MVTPRGRSGLVRLICLWAALFSLMGQGAGATPDQEEEVKGWLLMPRIGLGIEYGGFLLHDDVFTSMLRRRLEIDFLQYRRHIIFLDFDEETTFGTPPDRGDFNRMRHRLNLIGYRYDLGDYYLGAFFHHQCNNPIHTENYRALVDRARANLYLVGLEFLSKSMRLGMKDRGINFNPAVPFEFLGKFHGAFSVNKVVVAENIDIDWVMKAMVRLDLLRYRRLVPYVEAGGELLIGPQTRFSPSVEAGVRFHWRNLDFTPFVKWSRYQEPLTVSLYPEKFRLIAQDSIYAGARLEFLLDQKTLGTGAGVEGWQFFPEVHGQAGYALFLKSSYFKGFGDMELDFEALRYGPLTLFAYTSMRFNSRMEDFKPDKIIYRVQYGLTYAYDRYFAEAYVDQSKRLDGVQYRNVSERSNLAGLRAGTKGMKPGHQNDGIAFDGPQKVQWINLWNAQVSAGHYFQNRDWQYLWNVTGKVRWDPVRVYFAVPYVQAEVSWLAGGGRTDDAVEYAVEPGLRLHGVFDFALYYRFQHQENARFFRGRGENQSLFGIKALF